MFNVSIKNPLEAETVGQRRERKAKASEGSVCSRSSFRTRFETRSIKSNKFNVFGAFGRPSRYSTASLDGPLEILVKREFEVYPSELPASPQLSPPTLLHDAPWRNERGVSELSSSPSVCKTRGMAPKSPSPPPAQFREIPEEARQDVPSFELMELAKNYGQVKPHIENGSDDIIAPVEPEQSFPSPALHYRRKWSCSDRHDVSRNPSSLSSCSTSKSDTTSAAKTRSIHGQLYRTNLHMTNVSGELAEHSYVDTPDTIMSTEPEMDSVPAVSPLLLQPMVESAPQPPAEPPRQNEPQTQGSPLIPRQIVPMEDISPYTMRLMQVASNEIHYRRLSEHWHVVEPQLRRFVDAEQKLWALSGLKRLTESISTEDKTEFMIEMPGTGQHLPSADERRQVLHISDDAVESCVQAMTSRDWRTQLLYPTLMNCYGLPWTCLHSISEYRWPEIPILPYRPSSMHEIASRSLPLILAPSQWPHFLRECHRALKPGGVLSVTVQDPIPRNCGPLLRQWTMDHLVLGLEKRFLATHPGMIIPVWMDEAVGFQREEAEVFAYSAVSDGQLLESRDPACFGKREDERYAEPLRTVVGRYFYEALYSELMPAVPPQRPESGAGDGSQTRGWWWEDPAIVKECKELRTVFEIVTYRCWKRDGTDTCRPEIK